VIVNHDAVLVAPHAQLAAAVTVTVPAPPALGRDFDAGEIDTSQEVPVPGWLTLTDWSPTATVAVRATPEFHMMK
jgi:hypothetical protein